MAQLSHPNVVGVFEVGLANGQIFIASEYIDGPTLRQWLTTERSRAAIIDVFIQAGRGLAAAHRAGLIHRDFKPANVLVDGEARPRVLDFGLACSADEIHSTHAPSSNPASMLGEALTETGVLMGTPQYMSPEQFAGRADARSDQWAFCVTAWELLYGVRPFTAPDVVNLQRVIESGYIPGPPMDSPVPGWVERVLRRGISVDPAGRFADMGSLLSALQRDKRSRRMQILGLTGAVVLSAVITGSTMWVMRPEPTAESRAHVEQLEQEARAAASDGYFLYPPADEPGAATAFARVIALEQTEGPIAEAARERASALREELAKTLVTLGDEYSEREGGGAFAADYYAAALIFDPEQARARERSSLTPGELSTLRRKARNAEFSSAELEGARVLAALAEPDEPERTARVAALYRGKGRPAASTSLHLQELLGEAPITRGRVDERSAPIEAPDAMQRPATGASPADEAALVSAPDAMQRPTEPDNGSGAGARKSSASAKAETKAGRAALARGDDAAAEQAFHRALNRDPRNLGALLGLSELYFERGAYQKSLGYARKATAVAPRSGAGHMQLGDACFKVHRYDEARTEYGKAVKLGHSGAKRALERLEERVGGR